MKKRLLSLVLALALCVGLVVIPASAYDMGKVGEWNIISAGWQHTAAIDANGTLWTWGRNSDGRLGNMSTKDSDVPVKVLDGVVAVSCGLYHTAAIKTDGSLWMWGYNYDGRLGDGTTTNSNVPLKVMDNVAAVSCGNAHTAAIKTDGSLWMWGSNDYGQFGNGTQTGSNVPVKVLEGVAAVSCGGVYTAAIKTDGSLWMWGYNDCGQLGNGSTADSLIPVKVLDDVAAVSCGLDYTAAIKTDGSLWMWGRNSMGQLGNGGEGNAEKVSNGVTIQTQTVPVKVMDNVAAVSGGSYHTAAIQTDGSLWMWGYNKNGQLGNGGEGNATGRNYIGDTYTFQNVPVKVLDNVAAVRCGNDSTIVAKTDGSFWTWGGNGCGQLGNGTTTASNVPIQIPLSAPTATPTAAPAPQTVKLDGADVVFPAAYQIAGHNYVKLRDLATVLSGTAAQFEVGWDGAANCISLTTGQPYTPVTGDMSPIPDGEQPYEACTSALLLNGEAVELEAYTINGYNYFKLRDLGKAMNFNVSWNGYRVVIAPGEPYSDAQ